MSGMLGRNPRYDHRGYRSQIRRHLKFRLKNMGIPIPEWLEDKGSEDGLDEQKTLGLPLRMRISCVKPGSANGVRQWFPRLSGGKGSMLLNSGTRPINGFKL